MGRLIIPKIFQKAFWVTVACVSTALLINYGFEKLMSYLGVDEISYLKHYYDRVNQSESEYSDVSENIVMVSTSSRDRAEIAALIEKICQQEPVIVGVDMRFIGHTNPLSDSILLSTLHKYKDKIVLARASGCYIQNSFFDIEGKDTIFSYGLTNLPHFNQYIQPLSSSENLFPFVIARTAKPQIGNDKHLIINYENCAFDIYTEDMIVRDKECLRGKIVLLGDDKDEKDYHDIPFCVRGESRIPGLILHAYTVRSLIDEEVAFKPLPVFSNILLCFIITYLFSLFFAFYSSWGRKLSASGCFPLFLFSKPIVAIVADLLIIVLCYRCLTISPLHIVPNVVFYMISILLINNFDDFIEYYLEDKK